MVASGGMDGKVRVWRRIKGKSKVQEANSGQGEGQATATATVTGGISDSLEGWREWEFLTSLDTGDEITWIAWHPKGAVLAAGCNDSTVWMWQCEFLVWHCCSLIVMARLFDLIFAPQVKVSLRD